MTSVLYHRGNSISITCIRINVLIDVQFNYECTDNINDQIQGRIQDFLERGFIYTCILEIDARLKQLCTECLVVEETSGVLDVRLANTMRNHRNTATLKVTVKPITITIHLQELFLRVASPIDI